MACHHHHSNCPTTPCFCNHHCCNQSHHPPPPPQKHHSSVDPLLHTLISLLQRQHQQQQPYYTYFNHNEPDFKPQNLHFQRFDQNPQNPQTISLLSSLVERITNLEASIHHFSTSTSSLSNSSLRDAAARVIQTHFRVFLVRRSRTLRDLKELAFIKSTFNSLKSSVSNKTHLDSSLVSSKVSDLLLKLNSIQSADTMIIDGKRSIGREMVSFLESIGGFVVKKNATLSKSAKNNSIKFVRSGNKFRNLSSKDDDVHELLEKLRERVENIEGFSRGCGNDEEGIELEGFHQFVEHENDDKADDSGHSNGVYVKGHDVEPKVKKTVRFNDNGNVYTVYGETDESNSNKDDSSTDEIVSNDDRALAVEEIICNSDGTKRSSKSDEVKMKNRRNLRNVDDLENKGYSWDEDGNLVFLAPMPVKMESRTNLTKKKAAVQILT